MIIDGKKLSNEFTIELKNKIKKIKNINFVVILVGNDTNSLIYIKYKQKKCEELGINFKLNQYDINISEKDLLNEVEKINTDDNIDSCIIQLPLPSHLNQNKILNKLDPNKDADGFTFFNLGKLIKHDKEDFVIKPATVLGIEKIINYYNIETKGKNIVIIGKSVIVGTPLGLVLSNESTYSGTITLCDKNTENLREICKNADILIVSTGKHNLIDHTFELKKSVSIIDVGINRIKDESKKSGFRTEGDVEYNYFENKCENITPVPGGVGPMTVICLIENIINLKIYNHK
jgi:methylenetetrahydrofolate dehydrogenase (NADP+) / methenyltetrahydrofolate cyclohydrolase